MADVRGTHDIHHPRHRHNALGAFIAILIILMLAAVLVAAVMNLHGSISWPAGHIDFGLHSPLPQASPQTQ